MIMSWGMSTFSRTGLSGRYISNTGILSEGEVGSNVLQLTSNIASIEQISNAIDNLLLFLPFLIWILLL